MLEMWFLTVFGLMWSSPAIMALSLPFAISFSTWISRSDSSARIVAAASGAAVGESLISPPIAAKVLQRIRAVTLDQGAETIRAELSDREIEVLKLIANGKDNAMIAGELHISPKTVKNHNSNILMKLQIDNRIQAAVYAVRSGIV